MFNTVSRLPARLPAFLLLILVLILPLQLQAASSGDIITIREDAPDKYVVVRGDTLWDISARFLDKPWLWPQIWELNPQIDDPHWIYPGDVIGLVYVDGVPMFTLNSVEEQSDLTVIKLTPHIRRQAIRSAIPAISLEDINSFISGNSVISEEALASSPYLLDGRDAGIYSSTDDVIFARGKWSSAVNAYEIIRPGRTYYDPLSGESIGVEAILVGVASMVEKDGDQATLVVNESVMEARAGDRFIPRALRQIDSTYFPEPPAFDVNANVVAIQSGNTIGGSYDSLVLNVGELDNINVGHLLTVQKQDYEITDNNVGRLFNDRDREITFPGERFAKILVYRVFEESSLALVLNTEDVIRINDRVITP